MKIDRVLETCLYADDLAAAERFYSRVLGLEIFARAENRHVFFRCGAQMFLIFRPSGTRESNSVPAHGATGPGHVAFAVDSGDLDAWRRRLVEAGVPLEQEKTWPSGAQSLYFRDPADNSVELTVAALWDLPG
ncbi:MAG: VOC family protein [Candidatus Krumholzibacteriia bacterium]